MTAFDRAWDLVKMPIVPHSLREVGEGKHKARFIDPVSGEELLMTSGGEGMWELKISDKEGNNRAYVPMDSRDGKTFQSEGSETEEPYRRRGYMTALYDMAAKIGADEEEMRLRQGAPEKDGMGDLLWEKHHGGFWPIRDDLYEVSE